METWSRTVVLLLLTTVVTCSPLINDLPPGQEWPANNSVKQPFDDDPETTTLLILTEKESSTPIGEPLPLEVDSPDEAGIDASLPVLRSTGPESRVDYTGAQVWKVSTQNINVRGVIYRLRRRNLISTWGGNQSSIDILVKSNAVNNVTRVFKRERIPIEVVIEDLQQRINEENPELDPNEVELQNRRGHRMTWKQYHRVEDIHGFMDYLAKTYPKIVSVNTIGKSYEGRDLKILRISNGEPTNKAIFIDGGIHAREWISPATVTYFINQFAENFDVETDDIKNIDWYFLPVVNPDGYEYTHQSDRLWRKNKKPSRTTGRTCIGTDLNRNFGYRWGGKGSSGNPCSDIYRGSSAFSEPESKALSDFIKSSSANFTAYITYHSYGQYLLYPWGYDNAVPPDYKDLDEVGNRMASAIRQTRGSSYQVGSSSGLLYPASGGSDDWAKGQGIKYSFTIELSDTGRYGFVLPTSFIEPVARESLNGLRVLASQVAKL
ncbi:PREDICTED: carboxypeptidase B-like [Papilio polytes]|uniref:carboxypeptidase B-like n=1 Tax=Papilio polytes TaxID=76194 RepID=UPI0006765F6F|nr:PREDICTED: carboxypeptidase B-like [Papilio polytes]